ncbi:hypothetical protein NPIL_270011 [Nephila pilipes]|uniref:Uncharacterized protein n=1 Tax=Nephila pilipes TaxID=299642 RepID=A0A8X6UFD8_NEPPI|nr:hypothetical protein NPIL_270011 [Nephila pilipes]
MSEHFAVRSNRSSNSALDICKKDLETDRCFRGECRMVVNTGRLNYPNKFFLRNPISTCHLRVAGRQLFNLQSNDKDGTKTLGAHRATSSIHTVPVLRHQTEGSAIQDGGISVHSEVRLSASGRHASPVGGACPRPARIQGEG